MIPQGLGELLSFSAKKHQHRIAIAFGQKKITYKALNDSADKLAAGLLALGIKQNDRVALFLDNCPEFVIAYFAILKASAVVVPINYMLKMEEAKFILEDSATVCLITSAVYVDMAQELRTRIDSLKYLVTTTKAKTDIPDFNSIKKENTENLSKVSSNPADLAIILYTSGTTGFPKGAMLSHFNLISNAMDSTAAIKANHRDTFICILPLFHSFAATVCMNMPLLAGAKMVILKSVRSFKRIIRSIRRNRVTVFVAVPSIYNILKDMKLHKIFHSPLIKLFNPIRICISGAAALPVETLKAFENKFRIPLLEGYGLTEASPVVTLNPMRGVRKAGSTGVALSRNIELKVVNDKGEPLKTGEIGELLVRGPNVMRGYYNQKQASAEALKDGWLYTGDMTRLDQEGYVYIVGRKKEMVNVRGLNVYPREIEEVLYQNPKVKEAAVIGIPDTHKGEVPKAFVVLKENTTATEGELASYLRERLAAFKIPKHIELRPSLPKNTTGKILKRVLKEEEGIRENAI
jgi:long-chain acyl-CoA synthetase